MSNTNQKRAQEIVARLDHPVVDSDGYWNGRW